MDPQPQTQNDQSPPVFTPPPSKPGEWKIGEMYSKAWKITWNYKTLWIFGLALFIFGGFNFGSGGGTNYSYSGNKPANQSLEQTKNVLGASTQLGDLIGPIFANIPVYIYVILGIEFFLLIILMGSIYFIGRAWANAGLIAGTDAALSEKKLSLSEISSTILSKVKPLALLMLIPLLILICSLAAIAALFGILYGLRAIDQPSIGIFIVEVVSIIAFIAGIFILIFVFIMLSLSMIFAQRLVVLDNLSPISALKTGYSYIKKKFWWSILLGLVNTIFTVMVVFGVFIAILIVLGILFLGGLLTFFINKSLLVVLVLLGILVAIPFFMVFFPLANSLISVFKCAVWNQAYSKTKELFNG